MFLFFFFLVFAVQRDHQRIVTSKWAKEEKKNVRNKFPITARVLKQGGGKYISLSPLLIILWVLYILCYSRPRGNTRSMCFRHSFALMHNESEVCDGAILKRDLRAIWSIVLRRPSFLTYEGFNFFARVKVGAFASRQSAPKACGQLLSSRPFVLVFCRGVTDCLWRVECHCATRGQKQGGNQNSQGQDRV